MAVEIGPEGIEHKITPVSTINIVDPKRGDEVVRLVYTPTEFCISCILKENSTLVVYPQRYYSKNNNHLKPLITEYKDREEAFSTALEVCLLWAIQESHDASLIPEMRFKEDDYELIYGGPNFEDQYEKERKVRDERLSRIYESAVEHPRWWIEKGFLFSKLMENATNN